MNAKSCSSSKDKQLHLPKLLEIGSKGLDSCLKGHFVLDVKSGHFLSVSTKNKDSAATADQKKSVL